MKAFLQELYKQMEEDTKVLSSETKNKYSEWLESGKTKQKERNRKNSERNKENLDENSFLNYLPYINFNNNYQIIECKQNLGFALRVSIFAGIDKTAINALTQLITYEVPEDCYIQVFNLASPKIGPILECWEKGTTQDGIYKDLVQRRIDFYKDGIFKSLWKDNTDFALRDFELYYFFSFKKKSGEKSKENQLKRLAELRVKFKNSFINANCFVSAVYENELVSLIRQLINPTYDIYKDDLISANKNFNNNFDSHQEIELIHDGIIFKSSQDKNNTSNNKQAGFKSIIFEVTKWPSNWHLTDGINYVGSFKRGKSLPFIFYINLGFKAENQQVSERKTAEKRMLKTNQASSKLVNLFPAMATEINDWHYVSEQIEKGSRLSKAVMHIVAYIPCNNNNYSNTKAQEQQIKDHFYQLGFNLLQVKYDCANTLISTLPFGLGESWDQIQAMKIDSTVLSQSCVDLMPIFADSQNYNNPLMMLTGKRGQLFFFDCFNSPSNGNNNMAVFGRSGSGKSVKLQEYMMCTLRGGGQVVAVDDGKSFKNSTALLEGDFVDFGEESFCINPFSFYPDKKEIEKATKKLHEVVEHDEEEKKNQSNKDIFKADFEEPLIDLIVSTLCIITNIDKNDHNSINTGLYKSLLRKATHIVLTKKGNKGGFKDIREELLNNPRLRIKETESIANKIAFLLEDYAEGRYKDYFNGKATLSINSDLTVFELSSLESNNIIETSVLLTVIFITYTKMQSRKRRTTLIIDEAWRLLKHNAIKEFIEGFARRARKYGGNLVVATQNISDFTEEKSLTAAAVLAQSDWRVILSAESADSKVLKEKFGMKEGEIEVATTLQGSKGKFSECMIRHSSGSWSIGRLVLDPFSAKLYSTTAEEVVKIKELQDEGYKLTQAIELLATQQSTIHQEISYAN